MADKQMMTPLMQAEMASEILAKYGVTMADLQKQMLADQEDRVIRIAQLSMEREHLLDRITRALELDKEFAQHMRMPPRIRMILQRAVEVVENHAL